MFATALFYSEPCYDLDECRFTDIFNAGYFVMTTYVRLSPDCTRTNSTAKQHAKPCALWLPSPTFRVATVGYGSQVPSLDNGVSLVLTCIVMLFGQLYLSMPLAIIGKNYTSAWTRHDERLKQLEEEKIRRAFAKVAAALSMSRTKQPVMPTRRATYSESQPLQSCQVYVQSDQILSLFCELTSKTSETSVAIRSLLRPDSSTAIPLADSPRSQTAQALATKAFENLASMLRLHRSLMLALRASLLLQQARDAKRLKSSLTRGAGSAMSHQSAVMSDKLPRRSSSVVAAMLGKAQQALRSSEYPKSFVKKRYYHAGPPTFRSVMWNIFEHNDCSRRATRISRARLALIIASIALFYLQTTPELQATGISSLLCKRAIEDFCRARHVPGCFVLGRDGIPSTVRVKYHCAEKDPSAACFAHAFNFGSEMFHGSCVDAFGREGELHICNNRLCKLGTDLIVDMEATWVYIEVAFGALFTFEMLLRAYSHPVPRRLWRDLTLLVDLLALFPFYVEVGEILAGSHPVFSIVPTEPSFFTGIRVLKAIRIVKLGTHIPGARVLTNTARLVYQQLTIPLFFLFVGCVMSGAIFYELERGKACFVGQDCLWWGKNVLTPVLAEGLPTGKRVLIQNMVPATIVDMLRSTWFSLVTFTTVGYGDLTPRTSFGKLFDIVMMVFSACYTAMPLSLVGEQFYACYEAFVEDEKKHRVRKRERESGVLSAAVDWTLTLSLCKYARIVLS